MKKNDLTGILLINKAKGTTSFSLVRSLRRLTQVQKIGHAGTLDPLATGVMVMLIGRQYTRKSQDFLNKDKEYDATLFLGKTTDSYDQEGTITSTSDLIPTLQEIELSLKDFQGDVLQTPPMFSAKKIQGKKLYELARKGVEIERKPCQVNLKTTLISYDYPFLKLHVECSKGTYIRSIAHDLGQKLGCGAHLCELVRKRVGPYPLSACIDEQDLKKPEFPIEQYVSLT